VVELEAGRPHQSRLLAKRVTGYVWPKWVRALLAKVCRGQPWNGQRIRQTPTRTRTRRSSTGRRPLVIAVYTGRLRARTPGRPAPSRVLARTQIAAPASSTSSMRNA
jgi:hypothetical protein